VARRDLIVVGGGTAGLVAAVGAAGQGAKVTLVERARTGGDCLWTGCVPSKALLAAAAAAHAARHSDHLGVHTDQVTVDFPTVMAHVRGAIGAIAPHDSPERLRSEGVEVVHGDARFVADDAVEVGGRRRRFRAAMIATGAAPVVPPIEGLAAAEPLTTETVWDLEELPRRLVVLGGGPIGCELGQAFARLGAEVTIVEMEPRLLPREEPEASEVVRASLLADGVDVRTGARATAVLPAAEGSGGGGGGGGAGGDGAGGRGPARNGAGWRLQLRRADRAGDQAAGQQGDEVAFDRILVAVGRRPRTAGLGLEAAGIEVDGRGAVVVDERLRTTNRRVYAGGDVTALLPFTHVASTHGATVVQNAVFGLRSRVDHERIPWVTFTSPEVARVGLSVAEARERYGPRIRVRRVEHGEVNRAHAEGRTDGFALLIGDDKGRLIGATVVGPHAGETIGEVVAWRQLGAKVSAIARRSTHAYPTWSDDIAQASLLELRAELAKLQPMARGVLWARRLRR
jgi:pyruvate/2-oxoglutarate dehydrogenase complex dihydrolipoamide dehydrogenase (E3) component